MSAALVERPRLFREPPREIGRADAPVRPPESSDGGGLTLEQKLDSVWEGLRAGGAAECPVCQGHMTAGAAATPARCGGCGSQLT